MASAERLRRWLKGLGEVELRERFGTEEACRKALFDVRWREGLACPACGGTGFCALKTRKVFQCNRCKRQLRLTAGTVFQDTKLPLTTWFAAIYHLAQAKNGISSIELARRLGVRQPTAWLMRRKLMRAMAAREAGKPALSGRVEVGDAYLGGERQGGERGRGAAGKTPVVAAVETTPERRPRRLKLGVVKGSRKKEAERIAKRDLAAGTTVASACPAGRRSRRPAARTSRWSPGRARRPRAGRRSSGSTRAWATSRRRSPAPATTSAPSTPRPT
jgi:transposase-like protein